MRQEEYHFSYDVYDSLEELPEADAALLRKAREATGIAYAPYSEFKVGAAALLENGAIVFGANQENAAFPAGLCAERVVLASASSQYPGIRIQSLAVSYNNTVGSSNRPISPCGICRQSLQEVESVFKKQIRLILGGMEGQIFVLPQASALLPLSFTSENLSA